MGRHRHQGGPVPSDERKVAGGPILERDGDRDDTSPRSAGSERSEGSDSKNSDSRVDFLTYVDPIAEEISRSEERAKRVAEHGYDPLEYAHRSLFFLTPDSSFRVSVIRLVEHKWFKAVSLLVIIVNAAFLAAIDPVESADSPRNSFLNQSDIVFTALFTVELLLKIVAMGGFVHERSFFRDAWNWLDFLIVVLGWIQELPSSGGAKFSSLRTFRVLRPLRTIRAVTGMRVIIASLMQALPLLFNVLGLWVFSFFIFALIAIQLWAGRLRNRCYSVNGQPGDPANLYGDRICSTSGGGYSCPDGIAVCADSGENPNLGVTSFDHMGASILTIFQCITLEGWVDVMYYTMDASSAWSALYFVFVVTFGAFFIINLALAVIYAKFSKTAEEVEAEEMERKRRAAALKAASLAMLVVSVFKRKADEPPSTVGGKGAAGGRGGGGDSATASAFASAGGGEGSRSGGEGMGRSPGGGGDQARAAGDPADGDGNSAMDAFARLPAEQRRVAIDAARERGEDVDHLCELDRDIRSGQYRFHDDPCENADGTDASSRNHRGAHGASPVDCDASVRGGADDANQSAYYGEAPPPNASTLRHWCYRLQAHNWFTVAIMACIIINTIFLAIEHHNMPQSLADTQWVVNVILTIVFNCELVIKVVGLSLRGYLRDGFNIFDLIVVVISNTELILSGSGFMSVFRAFRLMRIFKLARSWDSLRALLEIILSSLPSISYCSFVLLLFIFIFAILGMQLFGGQIRAISESGEEIVPRHNFDNFLWAIVTIFQILTGENWNEVMYDTMRSTHWTAALYFVTVIVVGNYVVMNIFQAIVLQKFAASEDDEEEDMMFEAQHAGFASAGGPVANDGGDAYGDGKPLDGAAAGAALLPDTADSRGSPFLGSVRSTSGGIVPSLAVRQSTSAGSGSVTSGAGGPGAAAGAGAGGTVFAVDTDGNRVPVSVISDAAAARVQGSDGDQASSRRPKGAGAFDSSAGGGGVLGSRASTSSARSSDSSESSATNSAVTSAAAVLRRPRQNTIVRKALLRKRGGRSDSVASVVASAGQGGEDPDGTPRSGRPQPGTAMTAAGARRASSAVPVGAAASAIADGGRAGSSEMHDVQRAQAGMMGGANAASQGNAIADIVGSEGVVIRVKPIVAPKPKPVVDPSDIELHGNSLGIWSPDSPLRRAVASFVLHRNFEIVILILIGMSSLLLAVEHPRIEDDSPLDQFLYYADIFFVTVFGAELILKVIAFGLIAHRNAYLRSPWNVLDACVVTSSTLVLIMRSTSSISFLRVLRSMRPLRVVSRAGGMKIVANALLHSIPPMGNVLLVCLLFWFIFGILGVQVFKGRLYRCNLDWVKDRAECEAAGGEWTNSKTHFNHIFAAMLTLFEVSTLELWPDIMYQGVDAVGVDVQPQRDHNQLASLYYVFFIIIGGFFALNLFVGVVIDNFNDIKNQFEGRAFLTEQQQQWVEAQRAMMRFRPAYVPPIPTSRARRFIYDVASHKYFDLFIMGCIITNIAIMALEHDGEPDGVSVTVEVANVVFTSVFVLEAALKITATGLKSYLRVPWNRFDLFIAVTSLIGIFVSVGVWASIFKVFRVFRMFKLVRSARGLRMLLMTLFYSIPTLTNVGSLLLILFFMYAVAGVSLFGDLERAEFITARANFDHFGYAFLTLIRMATGESWNGIMHDVMDQKGAASLVYFVSFMLAVFFLLVNLFIAVILENFSDVAEEQSAKLTHSDWEEFSLVWAQFDPHGTGWIPTSELPDLLVSIPRPLGLGRGVRISYARRVAMCLHVPDYDGFTHFRDIRLALAQRFLGPRELPESDVRDEINSKWVRMYRIHRPVSKGSSGEIHAVRVIQEATRRWLARLRARKYGSAAVSRGFGRSGILGPSLGGRGADHGAGSRPVRPGTAATFGINGSDRYRRLPPLSHPHGAGGFGVDGRRGVGTRGGSAPPSMGPSMGLSRGGGGGGGFGAGLTGARRGRAPGGIDPLASLHHAVKLGSGREALEIRTSSDRPRPFVARRGTVGEHEQWATNPIVAGARDVVATGTGAAAIGLAGAGTSGGGRGRTSKGLQSRVAREPQIPGRRSALGPAIGPRRSARIAPAAVGASPMMQRGASRGMMASVRAPSPPPPPRSTLSPGFRAPGYVPSVSSPSPSPSPEQLHRQLGGLTTTNDGGRPYSYDARRRFHDL